MAILDAFSQQADVKDYEDGELDTLRKMGRRGGDLPWEEYIMFESRREFEKSDLPTVLASSFTRRAGKQQGTEVFHCRYGSTNLLYE